MCDQGGHVVCTMLEGIIVEGLRGSREVIAHHIWDDDAQIEGEGEVGFGSASRRRSRASRGKEDCCREGEKVCARR